MSFDEREFDERVIPLVRFFSENGLTTYMSCQGHNKTNMSMFWIQFDLSITQDDIIRFMEAHRTWYGSFYSNGRFAKRVILAHSVVDNTDSVCECWCYFAATPEAADDDLRRWTDTNNKWKGANDERYVTYRNSFLEKREDVLHDLS